MWWIISWNYADFVALDVRGKRERHFDIGIVFGEAIVDYLYVYVATYVCTMYVLLLKQLTTIEWKRYTREVCTEFVLEKKLHLNLHKSGRPTALLLPLPAQFSHFLRTVSFVLATVQSPGDPGYSFRKLCVFCFRTVTSWRLVLKKVASNMCMRACVDVWCDRSDANPNKKANPPKRRLPPSLLLEARFLSEVEVLLAHFDDSLPRR